MQGSRGNSKQAMGVCELPETLTECLLCGGRRLKPDPFADSQLNLAKPHAVVRCTACSFRFVSPRPTADEYRQMYESGSGPLADVYPPRQEFYGGEIRLRLTEYRRKLDILQKAGASGRLLELGSCTGIFLNEARLRGFEVEGVEPGAESRQTAEAEYGLKLCAGNVEELDFPAESFDVVFSSHVFEHLLDPLAVARKISYWLRPGGLHMLEVPNQFETAGAIAKRCHLWPPHARERSFLSIHHPVFFTPKTLHMLARLSGCDALRVGSVYYGRFEPLRRPASAFRRAVSTIFGGSGAIELLARKPADGQPTS